MNQTQAGLAVISFTLYIPAALTRAESHILFVKRDGNTLSELHLFALADKLRRLRQHKAEAAAVVPSNRAAFGGSNVGPR